MFQLRDTLSAYSNLSIILGTLTILWALYQAIHALYLIYFHPLRAIPGPKSWIAFPILRRISAVSGNYDTKMREFHAAYGGMVRYCPNEISFITASAWKDIYGFGHAQMPKAGVRPLDDAQDIINADDEHHTRFRKALSHGFSDKALRNQEGVVKGYVDLLIEKLDGFAVANSPVDMVKWYNLTTFDIIGDLAFGKPFGGLSGSEYHVWVKNIFATVKMIPFLQFARSYPFVMKMIGIFIPRDQVAKFKEHRDFTTKTAMERKNRTDLQGRNDFMNSMLKLQGDKEGLNDGELVANSNILILAGSETTATLLSGVTYWLLRTPNALAKLTDEIRCAFKSEEEIEFVSTAAKSPYLLACLTEGLRIYPPVPTNLSRRTLPGKVTIVSGFECPPDTLVSVHQSAAYWSESNFHKPRAFLPERWLPAATNDTTSPFYNDNRGVLQPFSVGPRNCIGQNLAYNEMRLILARVLWNFDLGLCEESEDWASQKSYLLWEKPALMCNLTRRSTKIVV